MSKVNEENGTVASDGLGLKDSSLSADLPIPEFALADLKLWFRRVLDDPKRLKYRSTTRSDSPVGEGYSYVEIPEWEFRQKQDLVTEASNGVNALLANPITQDAASASAHSQNIPDHSPASEPESSSDISSTLTGIRERRSKADRDAAKFGLGDSPTWTQIDTLLSIIDSLEAEKDQKSG